MMCQCEKKTFDLKPLDRVIEELGGRSGTSIPMLQRAQDIYGYLPPEVLRRISERTGIPLSQVYGVVTFYAQFYLTRELGIKAGETTPDYRFTFEVVYCLGSCGLSPVAVIDNKVVGRLVPEKMVQILRESK